MKKRPNVSDVRYPASRFLLLRNIPFLRTDIYGTTPTYLADELLQPADLGIRTRLRSALTTSLPVRRTRLLTVDNQAFPVTAAGSWNDLPRHVTSASSLPVFRSRLKTHLFRRSFSKLLFSACEVTLVITDRLIVLFTLLNFVLLFS